MNQLRSGAKSIQISDVPLYLQAIKHFNSKRIYKPQKSRRIVQASENMIVSFVWAYRVFAPTAAAILNVNFVLKFVSQHVFFGEARRQSLIINECLDQTQMYC